VHTHTCFILEVNFQFSVGILLLNCIFLGSPHYYRYKAEFFFGLTVSNFFGVIFGNLFGLFLQHYVCRQFSAQGPIKDRRSSPCLIGKNRT
jgi:hypothetical protein